MGPDNAEHCCRSLAQRRIPRPRGVARGRQIGLVLDEQSRVGPPPLPHIAVEDVHSVSRGYESQPEDDYGVRVVVCWTDWPCRNRSSCTAKARRTQWRGLSFDFQNVPALPLLPQNLSSRPRPLLSQGCTVVAVCHLGLPHGVGLFRIRRTFLTHAAHAD